MVKKTVPLPVCRAKTAYGVLKFVQKLILEEPKRYVQERFIIRIGGGGEADTFDRPVYQNDVDTPSPITAPACGTAGCVAGWVATVVHGPQFDYRNTSYIARRVLGLTAEQEDELFSASALDKLANGKPMPRVQTMAYAKLGVKHIGNFIKNHAAQLKATKVTR